MTETELQANIKRLEGEVGQKQMQLQMLKQQSMGLGYTFAAVVRELLLALGDPADAEQATRAKKHAKELLKHWDDMQDQQNAPPPSPSPLKVVPENGSTS